MGLIAALRSIGSLLCLAATASAATPPCAMNRFLTEKLPQAGYHLACFDRSGGGGGGDANNGIVGTIFRESLAGRPPAPLDLAPSNAADGSALRLEQLRAAIAAAAIIVVQTNGWPPERKQPWAMFSADGGHRLESVAAVLAAREVFIIEAGQFIWPAVRVGHVSAVRNLPGLVGRPIEVETLSLQPRVFQIKNFLKGAECDAITTLSKPYMGESTTVKADGDHGKSDSEWRTSKTHWLTQDHVDAVRPALCPNSCPPDLIAAIDARVANLTRVPASHQEAVQVLTYGVGGKYDAHMDPMEPKDLQQMPFQVEAIHHGHYARMMTVFWYLNDVEAGGETGFPKAGGFDGHLDHERAIRTCDYARGGNSAGMKVAAEKGKVIIFYNLLANGNVDEYSMHAGCPVEKGQKWAANKWVWNKEANMLGDVFDPNSPTYLREVDKLFKAQRGADDAPVGSMTVTFANECESEAVRVAYIGEDEAERASPSEMMTLRQGQQSGLSSFNSHSFLVVGQKSGEEIGAYTLSHSLDGREPTLRILCDGIVRK
jgi:prolyl 4-hydroxylase